jgi:ribosome-associated protein
LYRLSSYQRDRTAGRPALLLESPVPATPRAVELALVAAQAAADKVAHDIVVLDVSERLVITDCFVVCSAPNERQVASVVEEVERRMRDEGVKPVRREGDREARWVLLDFVDVVVHVQHDEERGYYALERLWKDCPAIPFVDRDAPVASAGG